MTSLAPLHTLDASRFDAPAILRKLALASRNLAELKGVAATIPNQSILINTLALQEAKDSSAIENIVTTHDELYQEGEYSQVNHSTKEVLRYRQALRAGFDRVRNTGLLTLTHIATRATPEDEREWRVRRWRIEVEQVFGDSIPTLT